MPAEWAAPVTTPTVAWRGSVIIPSGEVRPATRTPTVLAITLAAEKTAFGWLNWSVVALDLGGMIAVGVWFMRREKTATTDTYFRGGQRIPWWVAGLSIFATMLSSLTFMGIPARTNQTDVSWYLCELPILLVAPMVAIFYLPFFLKPDLTSAYEYLEKRFNLPCRIFAATLFILFHIGRVAIVLYLPALALAVVSDIPVTTAIRAIHRRPGCRAEICDHQGPSRCAQVAVDDDVDSVIGSMLFFGLGIAVYAFYKTHPESLDPGMTKTDAILPYFIMHELPRGVSGLLIAAIFAASQSTISSSLNSIAAFWSHDFDMRILRPNRDDSTYHNAAKWVVLVVGSLGTGTALWMAGSDRQSAFAAFNTLIGLTAGSLGGLFALGVFTRRANGPGALVGAVTGFTLVVTLEVLKAPVAGLLYAFIGCSVCFVTGWLASWLFRATPATGLSRRG